MRCQTSGPCGLPMRYQIDVVHLGINLDANLRDQKD